MLTAVPFIFVRHGETDWNAARRYQGRTDVPLNARGVAQAAAASEVLRGATVTTICSSPLQRAHDTAAAIHRVVGGVIEVIDDLAECDFGVHEGDTRGDWFDKWFNHGWTPPGGESHAVFHARALRGVNAALQRPGPVVIVAHGGVFWAVRRAAGIDAEGMSLPNAVPVRLEPPTAARPGWVESRYGP